MYPIEFTREEIEEAAGTARLLHLEIELGAGGSPRCPQCPAPRAPASGEALSQEEIADSILQAKELGAKSISVIDAEVEAHRRLLPITRFAQSVGLGVDVFTNGAGITAEVARELFGDRIAVALRVDSLDEETQDRLTGTDGSFEFIQRAFRQLRDAGYPAGERELRVATLICQQNVDEIVTIWRWLRDQEIACRFEIASAGADGRGKKWPRVDPARVREVFAEIARIERDDYGRVWSPQPARWQNGCMRHRFSCVIRWQGDVLPCVGLDLPIGNVRNRRLADIIQESEILEDLRGHRRSMKGPCASCEEASTCYGCRGAAFQLTGDYLASDPCCWRNADRQNEISRLPMAAAGIIPQELPMRIIGELTSVGERSGEVSVTVPAEMPFVGEDGVVDGAAFFELMAQSVAALNGFKQLGGAQETSGGYLVGAQNLEILGTARVGEKLTVSVYKDVRFGGFGIVKGTVLRDETMLARGEIKIWRDAESVPGLAGSTG